jgi:hypothetical protein
MSQIVSPFGRVERCPWFIYEGHQKKGVVQMKSDAVGQCGNQKRCPIPERRAELDHSLKAMFKSEKGKPTDVPELNNLEHSPN